MITRLIVRLGIMLSGIMAIICLSVVWIGSSIPTTRAVGYLAHVQDDTHVFGIADVDRRLYTLLPVPFESDWQVLFSPDGSRVLMTLDFYSQVEFYMLNFSTHEVTRFPLGYNICSPPQDLIQWSPDSRHITFTCRPNTIESDLNGLHLWDTDTNTVQRIYEPSFLTIVPYQWSPNGATISIIDAGDVILLDVATQHTLTIPRDESPYVGVFWSPQGDKVALGTPSELLIYTLQTGEKTPIFTEMNEGALYWSPNGEWIALIAYEGGFNPVYTWHIPTGESYRIGTARYPMNTAVEVRWSGDSQWVLIQADVNPADRFAPIFLASRDGAEGYRITTDGRNPRWVGNSTQMTYHISQIERLRYGRDLVMVSLESIRAGTPIPRLMAMNVLAHTWLADGRLLSWQSQDRYGGMNTLEISPAGGGIGWSLFPAGYSVGDFTVWH